MRDGVEEMKALMMMLDDAGKGKLGKAVVIGRKMGKTIVIGRNTRVRKR